MDSSKHDAPAPHGLDHSRIGHVLGYAVAQAEITTRKIYSKYIGHPMELRPVEFTILMLLLANERVTQKQLCQALVLSAPNLTVLLDKLQERGLLTRVRSDVDRRSQHILLTLAGEALARKAHEVSLTMERETLRLSEGERLMLVELLQKVARQRRG